MAVSSLSAISSALSLTFQPKLARQWNRMARTLAMLEAKPGQGKSVNWDVSLSGQTAATYTEGDDVASGELLIDAKQPAVLAWGLYRNAFGLTEHQIEAAMNSKDTAEELTQLLEESVFESHAALASILNAAVFAGTGSGALVGLDAALITSGTYGGIDVGTYPTFASTVNANGAVPRALTIDLMNTVESSIFTASGHRPDVIVTTPAIHAKYKGLFEPIRRVVGDSPGAYDTSVQDDMVYFMGIPVIRDKDCPAGKMYFLNRSAMHIAYMPPTNFGDAFGFVVRMGSGEAGGDGEVNQSGLPFAIKALAKTGTSVKFFVKSTCQLVVRHPNRCAVLKDLA